MTWVRPLKTFAALAVALLLWADDADARSDADIGHNKGNVWIHVWRPMTVAASSPAGSDRSGTEQPAHVGGTLGGLFSRPSLLGGFAAGFLGAGLLGFAFGHGFLGGLGSAASILGLLFQLALVAMLGRLIWVWWNGRNAPAFAGLTPRQLADPYLRSRGDAQLGLEALIGVDAAELDDDAAGSASAKSRPAAVADPARPVSRK